MVEVGAAQWLPVVFVVFCLGIWVGWHYGPEKEGDPSPEVPVPLPDVSAAIEAFRGEMRAWAERPVVIEKEVVREVPTIQEVVREVPVVVEKEVIRTVEVPVVVEKEVVREVAVEPPPGPTVRPPKMVPWRVEFVSGSGRRLLGRETRQDRRTPTIQYRGMDGLNASFSCDHQKSDGTWVYRRVSVEQ